MTIVIFRPLHANSLVSSFQEFFSKEPATLLSEDQILANLFQIFTLVKHMHSKQYKTAPLQLSHAHWNHKGEPVISGILALLNQFKFKNLVKHNQYDKVLTPPEIVQGQEWDYKSDIWSLGIFLKNLSSKILLLKGINHNNRENLSRRLDNLSSFLMKESLDERPTIDEVIQLAGNMCSSFRKILPNPKSRIKFDGTARDQDHARLEGSKINLKYYKIPTHYNINVPRPVQQDPKPVLLKSNFLHMSRKLLTKFSITIDSYPLSNISKLKSIFNRLKSCRSLTQLAINRMTLEAQPYLKYFLRSLKSVRIAHITLDTLQKPILDSDKKDKNLKYLKYYHRLTCLKLEIPKTLTSRRLFDRLTEGKFDWSRFRLLSQIELICGVACFDIDNIYGVVSFFSTAKALQSLRINLAKLQVIQYGSKIFSTLTIPGLKRLGLSFPKNNQEKTFLPNFIKTINKTPLLESFALNLGTSIGDYNDFKSFCKAIGHMKSLVRLKLGLVDLYGEGRRNFKLLFGSISELKCLRELDLNIEINKTIDHENLTKMFLSLSPNCSLTFQAAEPYHSHTTSEIALKLIESLDKASLIIEALVLNLRENDNIKDEVLIKLTELFTKTVKLKILDLNFRSCHKLTRKSTGLLLSSLNNLKNLTSLYLNFEYCDIDNLESLMDGLTGLVWLEKSDCKKTKKTISIPSNKKLDKY